MTSDSKTLSYSPKLKRAPIRMVVTSFGLGRGKALSGKDLVSQKLQAPEMSTPKGISPTKQLSPAKIVSPGKMNDISKAPSPAKLAKAPSPLKVITPANISNGIKSLPAKMVSPAKQSPAFGAFDGLYRDVAYHVDPVKKEMSFAWDFSSHAGAYNLPPAAMMKLNTIDYGQQVVSKQDAINHAKKAIDIIQRGVDNIFGAPNRNSPVGATAGNLTPEELERRYGKQPSPKNMVSPTKKLSPSLISAKLKTLETTRQPARGVGESRIPALNKRNPYTNANTAAHQSFVEKYTVVDLPKVQPTKQLSPAMISSTKRFNLDNVKPSPRNVKSPQTYTHTPVVKSMKVMLYKPDAGYKGDKNGENAVIKLGRGDIDGAFEEFKKGCMHFDRQCSYYDPMIRKSFEAFQKRLIAKYTKAIKESLAKGRSLDAELAFKAAWLASGKDDNDMQIYEEYIEQYPPKATSPAKKVSPGLKPYKPSNIATKFPSKGALTPLSKKAIVMPGKQWSSQFDPETGTSRDPYEQKTIKWLNEGADMEAYDEFFEGYHEFDSSVGDYAPKVEHAYTMLRDRLADYNMKKAKEAFDKFDTDSALEYFTKNWLNNDNANNKSQIYREFEKKFRLNNNTVDRVLPTKTKPVSPGWTKPSITQSERKTLEVKRNEIIDVLNHLVRNIKIDVTGIGSIKVYCGDINIAHAACVEAIIDGFHSKPKATLGKEIVFNGVSIKFSADRSRKLKQQKGVYRGYKYHIDPIAGTYGMGINVAAQDYDIFDNDDEFNPMHYTDEELLNKVKHEIDITIGSKPSPKQSTPKQASKPTVKKHVAQQSTPQKTTLPKPQKEKKVQNKKVVAPKVDAVKSSPVKRVSPIVAPERQAEVDKLKAEIAELSRQINEKAKIGIKATDLINAMNILVMKKAAIAGVRKGNKR